MEFDKNKVLTCVTADQTRVGQKGWFGETLSSLEKRVEKEPPKVLERVWLSGDRRYIFHTNDDNWSLFYPAPEPTYAERQAEWVKDNNVKVGTKVSVARTFTSYEDGCKVQFTPMKGTFIGDDCTVWGIESNNITVRSKQKNDWWCFPYFVLEVIKEPIYRPYNSEELNYIVGNILVRKCDGSDILVNERINPIKVRLGNGCAYTAEQLLELFTHNGSPCGMRE